MSSPIGQHSPAVTDQLDNTPTAKVTAGALAGAAVTVGVSIAEHFGSEIPADVAASLVVLLSGLAAYFKRSRPADIDH